KVVMLASLTDVWDSDKSCLAYREEIHKSTWQKRGNGAASNERACGDCAPHSDPLGCPDGRARLWLRLSRTARSRRRRLNYGVTAHNGFSQATVHAYEPPSPHL